MLDDMIRNHTGSFFEQNNEHIELKKEDKYLNAVNQALQDVVLGPA
jgi:hypothetical protein